MANRQQRSSPIDKPCQLQELGHGLQELLDGEWELELCTRDFKSFSPGPSMDPMCWEAELASLDL
jgi:hypothetical protein